MTDEENLTQPSSRVIYADLEPSVSCFSVKTAGIPFRCRAEIILCVSDLVGLRFLMY